MELIILKNLMKKLLGYSQTTDNNHNNSNINTIFWEKIIGDLSGTFGEEQFMREDALIYNIICH